MECFFWVGRPGPLLCCGWVVFVLVLVWGVVLLTFLSCL